MGLSKTSAFSNQQNQVAQYAKALAHPARVAILQYLLKKNACVCGDIVEALPLSQSTVSQHLRELKAVGLIQGTIEGPSVCYCIDPKGWQAARELLEALLHQKVDCC